MPDNASILERRIASIPRGIGTAAPIIVARAENAEIWDVEGNRYIDFASGIAATNAGHQHPRITKAAAEQADKFAHVAFQVIGLYRAGRASEQGCADQGRQDRLFYDRRRGDRKRSQDRARRYRAEGGNFKESEREKKK